MGSSRIKQVYPLFIGMSIDHHLNLSHHINTGGMMRFPSESKGVYLRRKRAILSNFTIALEFPSPEEAERAADYLRRFAIHKKYRDRDSVFHAKGSTEVLITYAPGAYMNEYPRSFVRDVIDRIYEALEKFYEREGDNYA